ncbi:P-loop NTPase fold protein [Amycolatopsis sp. WQ 127309]|uniref:KAP family P-loop NTPase fold protein n=1 Tax=Amycolatopsis sp. WQ 127309 TaxID=2932773 RepID=UPI001FF3823E|nr:P-loop NTPase fold protein [Amycolatopsis sp. WQ 127309]UOZ09359.1 KAP family NTPase [Amycolatopsis sp. WQ 127309]
MAHEEELIRELGSLRRGWGLETEGLRRRVGPLLSDWCDLHRAHNDREARRVLRDAIMAAIAEFPADDRLAVTIALNLEPGAQHPLLGDRIAVLAERLSLSDRSARRRMDRGIARLAAEIGAESDVGLASKSSSATVATAAAVSADEADPRGNTPDQSANSADSAAASNAPSASPSETKVDWATDAPAYEDHLDRASLADVLAAQLHDIRDRDPGTSFLIHLNGAWGTGKSTLLNFLEARVDDEFTVVWFDAWRQSRLGPPWWALLSATREGVARERNLFSRGALRAAEAVVRTRRASAAVTLSIFLLVIVIAGLAVFLLPRVAGGDALATLAKAVAAVAGTVATLWTGARVIGRTLLWDSVRGARLFEQSAPNPMDQVAAHFTWLLGKANRPILFFVDDLDRCPDTYVVDLLDAAQTLIRKNPSSVTEIEVSAAYFVVAADGAWLRKSYENAFPSFLDSVSTPGNSLGYLFLDKLFQLTVPVPVPSASARVRYLERLLGITDSSGNEELAREIEDGREALVEADDESEILEIINSASAFARDRLAGEAAVLLSTPQARARAEHALSKFLPLLHSNPRNIKRFLNTYNVLRSVRTLEQNTVPSDVLALWTILRVRWPSIADHLEAAPDAILGLIDPQWASGCLPPALHHLAADSDLRAVVLHPVGGPLTADLIRQCSGTERRVREAD